MFPQIWIRYGVSIAWEAIWLTRSRKSAVENLRWEEYYQLWCLDEWFVFDNPHEDTLVHLLFPTLHCNVCSKLAYILMVLYKLNWAFRYYKLKSPICISVKFGWIYKPWMREPKLPRGDSRNTRCIPLSMQQPMNLAVLGWSTWAIIPSSDRNSAVCSSGVPFVRRFTAISFPSGRIPWYTSA